MPPAYNTVTGSSFAHTNFPARYTHPGAYSNHNTENTNAPPALALSGQRLGPSGLKGGA